MEQKSPVHVAAALEDIFGNYGFPLILQSDNDKEFRGRYLLEELYRRCPSMVTMFGRPRTPRDQGSVENMNKHMKKCIHRHEEALRQLGKDANWMKILGSVQFKLNQKKQKGPNGVSAFDSVFGNRYKASAEFRIEESQNDL